MFAKQFIACMLTLALVNSISAEYNVNGVCTMVSSGTRIGSIESCQKYYVCNRGKATAYECPVGTRFSKNMQSCINANQVDCLFGESETCAGKAEGFVAKRGSCKGYIYCKNGVEVASGLCAWNLIFKDGECKYGDCPNSVANVDASFTSICQVLPNEKYFGSTKSCGKWQICKKEKLSIGNCDKNFVYDTETNSCNYESKHTCDRVTGVSIQPDPETFGQCDSNTDTMPSTTCSDYLLCENNIWTLKSCPKNFYFDKNQATCISRKAAITESCDRCQFSKKPFVNAEDQECRKYLRCENGVMKSSSECKVGYYFDESGQACIKGSAKNYAARNGACYSEPGKEVESVGAEA